jgi:hypothetical protein
MDAGASTGILQPLKKWHTTTLQALSLFLSHVTTLYSTSKKSERSEFSTSTLKFVPRTATNIRDPNDGFKRVIKPVRIAAQKGVHTSVISTMKVSTTHGIKFTSGTLPTCLPQRKFASKFITCWASKCLASY